MNNAGEMGESKGFNLHLMNESILSVLFFIFFLMCHLFSFCPFVGVHVYWHFMLVARCRGLVSFFGPFWPPPGAV